MIDQISESSLTALRAEAASAHEVFSANHHATQQATRDLQTEVARRETLADRCGQVAADLKQLVAESITAAANGALLNREATSLIKLRAKLAILRQSLAHFDCYDFADATSTVLSASVAELESQITAERLRLDLHESTVLAQLATAAELNGGAPIEIQGLDGIAAGMRLMVEGLEKDLADARRNRLDHDARVLETRAAYHVEFDSE